MMYSNFHVTSDDQKTPRTAPDGVKDGLTDLADTMCVLASSPRWQPIDHSVFEAHAAIINVWHSCEKGVNQFRELHDARTTGLPLLENAGGF